MLANGKLLNELLKYSKISRDKIKMEHIDVSKIVLQIKNDLNVFLSEKNVELNLSGRLPTVKCVDILINQVFSNLIINSAKYNDKQHKKIEIGYKSENRQYVFYVKDNGIGIKPNHLSSVFRLFKRLNAKEKYGDGTGFGLTLAKKL